MKRAEELDEGERADREGRSWSDMEINREKVKENEISAFFDANQNLKNY